MAVTTVTQQDIAKIRAILTGENERCVVDQYTPEQCDNIMDAINDVLTPRDAFTIDDLTEWAAAQEVDAIFADAEGLAKLEAWAIAEGWTKA